MHPIFANFTELTVRLRAPLGVAVSSFRVFDEDETKLEGEARLSAVGPRADSGKCSGGTLL